MVWYVFSFTCQIYEIYVVETSIIMSNPTSIIMLNPYDSSIYNLIWKTCLGRKLIVHNLSLDSFVNGKML